MAADYVNRFIEIGLRWQSRLRCHYVMKIKSADYCRNVFHLNVPYRTLIVVYSLCLQQLIVVEIFPYALFRNLENNVSYMSVLVNRNPCFITMITSPSTQLHFLINMPN